MLLGDLGAEVIKVEIPRMGDDTRQWGPPFVGGESAYFLSINRNKKSLTLDLSKDKGREILYALAEKSDILLENFRPGVTERLQVDYPRLAKKNPRLIYCSITSYGHTARTEIDWLTILFCKRWAASWESQENQADHRFELASPCQILVRVCTPQ